MTATTRLNKILIRVGRTGALNPWAMIEPVEVGGVTVSRATLHNEEDINRKDIREGDDVIVQRAGDVIPQIVGPGRPHRKGTKPFRMPKKCPLCGTEIVKPEGEVMHRCPNRACPSRGLETLINWVEGPADIEGVGEQTVRRLWEKGLVRSLPDLYRLTKEQLLELEGFAEISATPRSTRSRRRRRAVLARPPRPQHPQASAGCSRRASPAISAPSTACSPRRRRRSRRWTASGRTVPRSIVEWFEDEQNRALVEELRSLGLRFELGEEDKPKEGPLTGKTYVITGTLERWSREQAARGARGARARK